MRTRERDREHRKPGKLDGSGHPVRRSLAPRHIQHRDFQRLPDGWICTACGESVPEKIVDPNAKLQIPTEPKDVAARVSGQHAE